MTNKKRDLELLSKILFAIEDSPAEEITTPQSLNTHESIQNGSTGIPVVAARCGGRVR